MEDAYDLFTKARDLMKKSDYLNASFLLEMAKGKEPEKGSIREALAISYFNMGLYKSAKKNFRKAIDIDAANDFAHFGMGLCLVKENKTNMAVGHFKIARFMKPNSPIYNRAVKRYKR